MTWRATLFVWRCKLAAAQKKVSNIICRFAVGGLCRLVQPHPNMDFADFISAIRPSAPNPRFIWTGIGTAFYNPAVDRPDQFPYWLQVERRRRNDELLGTTFGLNWVDSLIKPV
jgi:hypothetical protein